MSKHMSNPSMFSLQYSIQYTYVFIQSLEHVIICYFIHPTITVILAVTDS